MTISLRLLLSVAILLALACSSQGQLFRLRHGRSVNGDIYRHVQDSPVIVSLIHIGDKDLDDDNAGPQALRRRGLFNRRSQPATVNSTPISTLNPTAKLIRREGKLYVQIRNLR